jgi:lipopolysaccharide export system protein LptA
MKKYRFYLGLCLVLIVLLGSFTHVLAAPPNLPSSFYGEIHFMASDGGPIVGDFIEAYVPGRTPYAARAAISTYLTNLIYVINVPGDDPATTGVKEGGVESDVVTFKIGTRIVATGIWHSGTSVELKIHPPKANAGGPYVAVVNESVSLSGSATDWLATTFTYAWDLDNNGTFGDSVNQNPSYTFTSSGTKLVGLRAKDSQNGEGFASSNVVVIALSGLTGQVYDGSLRSVSVSGVAAPYSYTITYNGNPTAPVNAGSYTVVVSINNGATLVGTITKTLVVDKRPISVTANVQTKVYGNTDPGLTYQVTSGSLVSGDSWSGTLVRTAGENVGPYAINKGSLSAGTNYDLTFIGANLTITQRPITIKADDKQKLVGESDPPLTYGITSGSLAFSDTFSGGLTREAGTSVGTYRILQGTLALNANYALTYQEGTFTIAAAIITVTATPGQSKVFGTADPVFAYTYSPNNPPISFTGALSRATGENVGVYALTKGTLSAGVNYTISFVPANFSITPAPATISISNLNQDYDGTPKPVTITTVPSGLAHSVTYNGSATVPSNTGIYTVVATITNTNYAATPDTDQLVIRATQSLTLKPGWNLISFNLQPYPSTAPVDILAPIVGKFDQVYAWDANVATDPWLLYDDQPLSPDNLTVINEKMGIWIHITAATDQTLAIKGFKPSTTAISLHTEAGGWNLVGFPAAASNPSISNALSSLAGKYTLVYTWNVDTQSWISYDPSAPTYANDLTTMDPGKGYWIKITEHLTWNVPY